MSDTVTLSLTEATTLSTAALTANGADADMDCSACRAIARP